MIEVSRVSAREQETALAILFRDLDDASRQQHISDLLEQASIGQLPLDGLLLAKSDGRPVGCGLYLIERDQTAFVWPPAVDAENCLSVDPENIADAILQRICREVDAADAWIGQCILEGDKTVDQQRLIRNGFGYLTDLVFMQRQLTEQLPASSVESLTAIEYQSDTNRNQFIQLLQRTFQGTLDCPELRDRRSAADMLDGFDASRPKGRAHWKLYQSESQQWGIVLINERPEDKTWEIIYMGVVPEARGKKLGREMLLASLDGLSDRECDSIMLAVDCRNHYAIDTYDEIGFEEIGRRSIYCRTQ